MIFGIGLERTGTTSLSVAMQQLGFRVVHFPHSVGELSNADFANDLPVASQFDLLDRLFPDSKFILTTREEDSWLASCDRWYKSLENAPRNIVAELAMLRIYGQNTFNPELWVAGRRKFYGLVANYFQNSSHRLLTLDICAGEGWEKLIPFVSPSFPLENVGAYLGGG